jgi:hypothetical protein
VAIDWRAALGAMDESTAAILARRQAEQGQLADFIKLQDNLKTAEANRKGLAVQREAAAENLRAQAKQREAQRAAIIASTVMPGQTINSGLSQELDDIGFGHLKESVEETTGGTLPAKTFVPGMSGAPEQKAVPSVGGVTTKVDKFRGTPDQLEEQRKLQAIQELAERMKQDPASKGKGEMISQFIAAGAKPEKVLDMLLDAEKPGGRQGSWKSKTVKIGDQDTQVLYNDVLMEYRHPDGTPVDTSQLKEINPTSSKLTPEAAEMAAYGYLASEKLPALGMGASGDRIAILNAAAKLGGPNASPTLNAALNKADTAALVQNQKTVSAISAYKNTAKRNIEVLKDKAGKVIDAGFPLANAPFRSLADKMGNRGVAEFEAARRALVPEIARILTQPNLTGVLSVEAQKEADKLINDAITWDQLLGVIDVLEKDMDNRTKELDIENDILSSRIGRRGRPADKAATDTAREPRTAAPAAGGPAPSAAAPKEGTVGTVNGQAAVWRTGPNGLGWYKK